MKPPSVGLAVIALGVLIVIVGTLLHFGALNWFGRLPGDFRYAGERTRVYFPFVSMLLVSALLSVLLYLYRRFL